MTKYTSNKKSHSYTVVHKNMQILFVAGFAHFFIPVTNFLNLYHASHGDHT